MLEAMTADDEAIDTQLELKRAEEKSELKHKVRFKLFVTVPTLGTTCVPCGKERFQWKCPEPPGVGAQIAVKRAKRSGKPADWAKAEAAEAAMKAARLASGGGGAAGASTETRVRLAHAKTERILANAMADDDQLDERVADKQAEEKRDLQKRLAAKRGGRGRGGAGRKPGGDRSISPSTPPPETAVVPHRDDKDARWAAAGARERNVATPEDMSASSPMSPTPMSPSQMQIELGSPTSQGSGRGGRGGGRSAQKAKLKKSDEKKK